MKNTIIWGLEKPITSSALQALAEERKINIIAWFGNPKESKAVTHNGFDLLFGPIREFPRKKCDAKLYNKIYKNLYVFMDMLSRAFFFQNKPVQEYLNIYNLLLDYFYFLLTHQKIELIIFDDAPHDGPNYLLYCLAKEMGICTLLVCQSFFPDRFFYTYDIEDFGLFENIPEFQEMENIKLQRKYEKDLFYMKPDSLGMKMRKKLTILFNFSTWKQQRMEVLRQSLCKYDGLYDQVLQHAIRKISEHKREKEYRRRVKALFVDKIDKQAKFVYFPLHLQPEMTTSALGGVYCDQLLAVERLANWLPPDWEIVVKENPKQSNFMRGKLFFERLRAIPKVRVVALETNTYELIKNCQFVATISGTAGWEAISGGKKTVIFGKAWYRFLPGVFYYSEELSLNMVLSYELKHAELEAQLAVLMKKAAPGIVNVDYLETLPTFQSADNHQKISAFFYFILQEMDSSIKASNIGSMGRK